MERYLLRSNSSGSLNSKRPATENVDGWRTPKRPAVAKHAKFDSTRDIPTHNKFQELPVDGVAKTAGNEFYLKAATKVKKTGHIPPIIVDMKTEWTHEDLKDKISEFSNQYHLQYRNGGKVAILCHTADGHRAVKDGLRRQDASFVTFTRKDEKVPKSVIRGLPAYVEQELPDELDKIGFTGASVKPLKSRKGLDNPCPPFLVQLPAGADITRFRQIRYLCNCVVSVSKFKPNRAYGTQCFRCQEFGHASHNCNKPPRCVKCVAPHATASCTKSDRTEPAQCCNCNEDHPANYSKCSVRLAYLDSIEKKKALERKPVLSMMATKATLVPPILQHPTLTSNQRLESWPTLGSRDKTSIKNQVTIDHPTADTNDGTTKEMFEILLTLKNIKSKFAACTSWLDKVMLVLSHLGKYV